MMSPLRSTAFILSATLAMVVCLGGERACVAADAGDSLEQGFLTPPDAARPWTYWFWLNGNITREGITADLEAMRRVGLGGVLIMEVDVGVPAGNVPFASPLWREHFKHVCQEAARLGLEVNMNNDAGWCGSGGPWNTPEVSMQKATWSETAVAGPRRFDDPLPQPPTVANYYRDVAVVAFPTPAAGAAVVNLKGKAVMEPVIFSLPEPASWPAAPAEQTVAGSRIVDLTSRLTKDGRIAWDVPEGNWTILRFGHTTTGAMNGPSPAAGRGYECDKLSRAGAESQFAGLMGKLLADNGPLVGKSLVSIHIDSWEIGVQNWTAEFRQEFQRRRGYDLAPWLPVITGRVVDNLEASDRFLWDFRQTISDLLLDNYAERFRELAHQHGLRFSIEAYDKCLTNELTYAGHADEPMGEFWSWPKTYMAFTTREMTSAGHVYGKPIIGAEAFTAMDPERWLSHPGNIKEWGDWAFCEGINRFVFHRYALQPWLDRKPGVSMGPYGLHYERTQTWWEQSKAWHEYLARCQFLLQQGLFAADACFLTPEGSPQSLQGQPSFFTAFDPAGAPHERRGYNYDACPPEVVMTRMSVKDGRLVLPDGMSYRLLVLPAVETMTPALLTKIKELVAAGATIAGPAPVKSPSLSEYPKCDDEVRRLAGELFGGGKPPATVTQRAFGKGRVFWGGPLQKTQPQAPSQEIDGPPGTPKYRADLYLDVDTVCQVLKEMGVVPDFRCRTADATAALRYTHRTLGGTDVYFVSNMDALPKDAVCSFRVAGRRPELWWPEAGRIERAAVYDQQDGCTQMPIHFDAAGSVFVLFREGAAVEPDRIVSVTRDDAPLLDAALCPDDATSESDNNAKIKNTFTMAVWAKPTADTALPNEADRGNLSDGNARNDALYPPPGHEVYSETGQVGSGLAIGRNGVCVFEHGASYFAPPLVAAAPLADWTHVAVVYRDGTPSLYLNGRFVRTGMKSQFVVHPGVGVRHGRAATPFQGELGRLVAIPRDLSESEIVELMTVMPRAPAQTVADAAIAVRRENGAVEADLRQPGEYTFHAADGQTRRVKVGAVPESREIAGPWQVRFAQGWGAPEQIALDKLISWSQHEDPGVKHFSGSAVYHTEFDLPADALSNGRRLVLDLGRVEVVADVAINGQPVGTLWKSPFTTDVTERLKAGKNSLDVTVTNLWVNRMIGDEELPEDSDRLKEGNLKSWPQWLLDGKPSPTGRLTFTTWRRWNKDAPLLDSGLLGPVVLKTIERVSVER